MDDAEIYTIVPEKDLPIIDILPSMVFIANSDGSCNYFNRAWLDFTGRTLSQEIGTGFTEGLFKDDLERCMKALVDNFAKRISFSMEFRLKNVSGEYRWIKSDCNPLIDKDNLFKGYVGACFDIQDIKYSEEKNRKFSRAVEQSPLSIVITDIKGTIEYVNPKFSELTGYSYDESIGKNPRILQSGHHDKAFYKEMWDTVLSGKTWTGEIYNVKRDGELFIEEASINPVKNDYGIITNFVAIKQDITKRKADAKELENKNAELERFNKLAIDRELKMIELKREIGELKKKFDK